MASFFPKDHRKRLILVWCKYWNRHLAIAYCYVNKSKIKELLEPCRIRRKLLWIIPKTLHLWCKIFLTICLIVKVDIQIDLWRGIVMLDFSYDCLDVDLFGFFIDLGLFEGDTGLGLDFAPVIINFTERCW